MDSIERWKNRFKVSSEPVTIIYGRQRARIILDTNYSDYYLMTIWATIRATKKNYYLCEYECPNTFILMKEWIHENYLDLSSFYQPY